MKVAVEDYGRQFGDGGRIWGQMAEGILLEVVL
jgi:hypothetical protein